MKKVEQPSGYERLIRDITALYDQARRALVASYWEIGKRIVKEEQQALGKAAYGTQLVIRLSQDLREKLGNGFSVRNLRNMRRFYLKHPNRQPAADLTWSQHVELMPIADGAIRRRLEHQVMQEKLSRRQVRHMVRRTLKDRRSHSNDSPQAHIRPAPIELPCERRPLQVFARVTRYPVRCARGRVVIDCGFSLWQTVATKDVDTRDTASYTYPAQVESVIDGDTLWAIIDCTRGIYTRQKLRLHRIDTPERGTSAGEKARRFVMRQLKVNSQIVIQTHKYDKYARYLADVFYLPGSTNPKVIIKQGIHLNQQLLDKGLAKVWKSS